MPAPRKTPWTPPHRIVLGFVCLLVVLLNAFDALATLEIVRRGGEEANPIARPMLDRGNLPFFLWKMGLALVCSAALALLARTRDPGAFSFLDDDHDLRAVRDVAPVPIMDGVPERVGVVQEVGAAAGAGVVGDDLAVLGPALHHEHVVERTVAGEVRVGQQLA